jgi:sigma-B regulation protein RsbU (phosphoserine phosphatase)
MIGTRALCCKGLAVPSAGAPQRAALPRGAVRLRPMFFRRKKPASPGAEAPPAPAESPAPGPAGDSATTQFLTGDQAADRRSVQILLEAIARVSEARDLEELLLDIVDRSVEVTGAERGLLLLERADGELTVRVARSRERQTLADDVRFSTTIARRVLEDVTPLKATVQSDTEALELGRSVFDLRLRAVMCVPLSAAGSRSSGGAARPQGVLYVDTRAATRQFKQRDLSLFAALAQHISIAMHNARLHLDSVEKVRLEQSLELASAIQRDLMPPVPTSVPGFDVHGWYRPAERAAGDFYDFVEAEGGSLGVVVGDVTGHGIGPALITASAQGALQTLIGMIDDLGTVVTRLNRQLSKRIDDGRFLTLFVALLGPDGRVRTVNAGHPPALLWRAAEGRCIELGKHGPAIGMVDDERYPSGDVLQLERGDALVAYTDGVTEARDPSAANGFLGRAGLARLFGECMRSGKSARETALFLAEEALRLSGAHVEDDITLVVARRI